MKHAIEIGWRWDALVLVDPPNVPPVDHPRYAPMEAFEKDSRNGRSAAAAASPPWTSSRRIPAVAGDQLLGPRRARADGALSACARARTATVPAHMCAGERSRDLRRGAVVESLAARDRVRRTGQAIGADPNLKGGPATALTNQRSGPRMDTITTSSPAPGICCRSRSRRSARAWSRSSWRSAAFFIH